MTPLTEIGWFRNHKAALWWLGLLYRRPRKFASAAGDEFIGSRWHRLALSPKLYLHLIPYMVLLVAAGRLLLFGALDLPREAGLAATDLAVFHITQGAGGIAVLRGYYQLLFLWLSWPWPLGRLYRLHPVAWDDLCGLPFPNLSGLLVAYGQIAPRAADDELARMERDCPAQRSAALRARTILLARRSAAVQRLTEIEPLIAGLPQGNRGYLRQTQSLYERASSLVAQARRVETTTIPVLRIAETTQLCLQVHEIRNQIAGYDEPLATEFLAAAGHWLKLADRLHAEAQSHTDRTAWPQVFRAGDRIMDRQAEAFVRRDAVLDDLQQQFLLATGCPGILLYGRRRVGKSTVLTNLTGFLP